MTRNKFRDESQRPLRGYFQMQVKIQQLAVIYYKQLKSIMFNKKTDKNVTNAKM